MANGWLGSYSPNLPNCNYHRHSWFQDLGKGGRRYGIYRGCTQTLWADLECLRHKSSDNLNIHPPFLWYPWLRHPLARMDHGLDSISLNLHSAKHLLSQSYPLSWEAFSWKEPLQIHHHSGQHILSPNRWEWSFKSSEWRLKLLIDPIISSQPHFKLLVP